MFFKTNMFQNTNINMKTAWISQDQGEGSIKIYDDDDENNFQYKDKD